MAVHLLQVERYAEGVRRFDFDAGLVPYPLDSYSLWQRLTPHVTAATVKRVAPRQACLAYLLPCGTHAKGRT